MPTNSLLTFLMKFLNHLNANQKMFKLRTDLFEEILKAALSSNFFFVLHLIHQIFQVLYIFLILSKHKQKMKVPVYLLSIMVKAIL